MSGNEEPMALTTPPAIHVGPIVTPGSNETISIVIPLSAQLTTVASQSTDQSCKDCGKDMKKSATPSTTVWQRPANTKGCPFPTCSRYGRAFSRAHDLKRHIARHEMRKERLSEIERAEIRNCSECGQNFANEIVLRKHAQCHLKRGDVQDTNGEVKWYFCHLCKKRYTQESKLKAHISAHNKKAVCNICALCGSRFDREELLQNHMKEHTSSILQAQAAFGKLDGTQQVALQGDGEFLLEEMLLLNKKTKAVSVATTKAEASANSNKIRCDYCSKTFKSKWTLNSHVAAHEGRFQFDCGQCGKRFVRKSHFEGHVRSHEAARPYVCEQCGKTFKELKHRREHTKRKHPGNQNAIQSLLDSITACVAEETATPDQPKFTLLMPMDFNV
ncbi:zinc finger protein 510 [Cephus cinctus]|uniref:Zinc finger protein 510 n=1 Tax=Cephus cinctus TaxID=211228 RepID=A0AAJ7BXV2_CEPCN|nr:zinc finger protein 510 [Cephus cinctus]